MIADKQESFLIDPTVLTSKQKAIERHDLKKKPEEHNLYQYKKHIYGNMA